MRVRRNRHSKVQVSYPSEAAMCEVLAAEARAAGWLVYPETGNWDMLLVRPGDGTQVGVQAKLRANVEVLDQALVPARQKGPNVHAVLVPSCSGAFRNVALELKLLVLEAFHFDAGKLSPGLKARYGLSLDELVKKAPRHTHLKGPCWVPPFVPEGPCGVPGPRQVTKWKVGAAQLCARLRAAGHVTSGDFRELGLALSTWTRRGGWLERVPGSAPALYRVREGARLPDEDFQDVVAGLGLPLVTVRAA